MKLRLPFTLLAAVLAVFNSPAYATFPSPPTWEAEGNLTTYNATEATISLSTIDSIDIGNLSLTYTSTGGQTITGNATASNNKNIWISIVPPSSSTLGAKILQGSTVAMVGDINLKADGFRPTMNGSMALTGVAGASSNTSDKTVTGNVNLQANDSNLAAITGVISKGRMDGDLTIYLTESTGTTVTGIGNGNTTDLTQLTGSLSIALQNSQFTGAVVGAGTYSSVSNGINIFLDNTQLCKETTAGTATTYTGQGITGTSGIVTGGGLSIFLSNGSQSGAITGGAGIASHITEGVNISLNDSVVGTYSEDTASNTIKYLGSAVIGSAGTVDEDITINSLNSKSGAITAYSGTGSIGAVNVTVSGSYLVGGTLGNLTFVGGEMTAFTGGTLTGLSGKGITTSSITISVSDSYLGSIVGAAAGSTVGTGMSIESHSNSIGALTQPLTGGIEGAHHSKLWTGGAITGTSGVILAGGLNINVHNSIGGGSSLVGAITGGFGTLSNITGNLSITISDTIVGSDRYDYAEDNSILRHLITGSSVIGSQGTVEGNLTISLSDSYAGAITGGFGIASHIIEGVNISLNDSVVGTYSEDTAANTIKYLGSAVIGSAGTVDGDITINSLNSKSGVITAYSGTGSIGAVNLTVSGSYLVGTSLGHLTFVDGNMTVFTGGALTGLSGKGITTSSITISVSDSYLASIVGAAAGSTVGTGVSIKSHSNRIGALTQPSTGGIEGAHHSKLWTGGAITGTSGVILAGGLHINVNNSIEGGSSLVGAITGGGGALSNITGNLSITISDTIVGSDRYDYAEDNSILRHLITGSSVIGSQGTVEGNLTISLSDSYAGAITGLANGTTALNGATLSAGELTISLTNSIVTTITGAGTNSIVGKGISINLDNTQALIITNPTPTASESALGIVRINSSAGQSLTGTSGMVSNGGVTITVENTETDPVKKIQSWIGTIIGGAGTANITGDVSITVSDTTIGTDRIGYDAGNNIIQQTFSGGGITGLASGTAILPSQVNGSITMDLESVILSGDIIGAGSFSKVSGGIVIGIDNTQAVSFSNILGSATEQTAGTMRVKLETGQRITGTAGLIETGGVSITVTQTNQTNGLKSWIGGIIGGAGTANITGNISINVSDTLTGNKRYEYNEDGVEFKQAFSSGAITGLAKGTADISSRVEGMILLNLDSVLSYGYIAGSDNFSTVTQGISINLDNTQTVSFTKAPALLTTDIDQGIAFIDTYAGQAITGTSGLVEEGGININIQNTHTDAKKIQSWIGGITGATATANITGDIAINVSDTFIGTKRYGYSSEGNEIRKTITYGEITGITGSTTSTAKLSGNINLTITNSTLAKIVGVDTHVNVDGLVKINVNSNILHGPLTGSTTSSTVSQGITIDINNTQAILKSTLAPTDLESALGIVRSDVFTGQSITGTASMILAGGVQITIQNTQSDKAKRVQSWVGGITGAKATANITGDITIDVSDTFIGTERYGYSLEGNEITKTITYGEITGITGSKTSTAKLSGDINLTITNSTVGSLLVAADYSEISGKSVVEIHESTFMESVYAGGRYSKGVILGTSTISLSGTNHFASVFCGEYINTLDASQTKGLTDIIVKNGITSFTSDTHSMTGINKLTIQNGATVALERLNQKIFMSQSITEKIDRINIAQGSTLSIGSSTERYNWLTETFKNNEGTAYTTISGAGLLSVAGGAIVKMGMADDFIGTVSLTQGAFLTLSLTKDQSVGISAVSGQGFLSILGFSKNAIKNVDSGITLYTWEVAGDGALLANDDSTAFIAGTETVTAGIYGEFFGGLQSGAYTGYNAITFKQAEGKTLKVEGNFYGAGKLADMIGNVTLNFEKVTMLDNVYGGGLNASVDGNVVMHVSDLKAMKIYGGSFVSGVEIRGNKDASVGDATININKLVSGAFDDIFGGGASYNPQTDNVITSTVRSSMINISAGTFSMVFGGGESLGSYGNVNVAATSNAVVTNSTHLVITGGHFNEAVIGGGKARIATDGVGTATTKTGDTWVQVSGENTTLTGLIGGSWAVINLLPTSSKDLIRIATGDSANTRIDISGGEVNAITSSLLWTSLEIMDKNSKIAIVGGGAAVGGGIDVVDGVDKIIYTKSTAANTEINISGGTVKGHIVGGGLSAAQDRYKAGPSVGGHAIVEGNVSIMVSGDALIEGNIYAGGRSLAGTLNGQVYDGGISEVLGNASIVVNGGTITGFLDGQGVNGTSTLVWNNEGKEGYSKSFTHITVSAGSLKDVAEDAPVLKELRLAKDTNYTLDHGDSNYIALLQGPGNLLLLKGERASQTSLGNVYGKANVTLSEGNALAVTGVADMGTLAVAGALTWTGTLNAVDTVLNSGFSLTFKDGDSLAVAGILSLNGQGQLTMDVPITQTTSTLISYGSFTGDLSNLVLNKVESTRYNYTLVNNAEKKQIQLVVDGKAMDLTWVGAEDGSGIWGLADDSKAWTSPELGGMDFFNMDSVLFDKKASITVSGLVQANRLKVGATGSVSLDGTAGTVSALSTDNAGSLTILAGSGHQLGSMNNQGSFIADGSSVGASSWLGAGNVSLNNGASLSIKGNATMADVANEGSLHLAGSSILGALSGAGSTHFNGGSLTIASMTGGSLNLAVGNVTISGNAQITSVQNNANLALAGTSTVETVTGTGHLSFKGTNLSLGSLIAAGLEISSGTVNVQGAMTVNTTTLTTGSILNLAGESTLGAVAGAGIINITADTTMTSLVGKTQLNIAESSQTSIFGNAELGLVSNAGTLSLAGANLTGLTGAGTLNNSGILSLQGNSFEAGTISGGMINLQSGSATAKFIDTSVAVNKSASLNLKNESNLAVSGEGTVIVEGAASSTLKSIAGNNLNNAGTVDIAGASSANHIDNTGTLNIKGKLDAVNFTASSNAQVSIAADGALNVTGGATIFGQVTNAGSLSWTGAASATSMNLIADSSLNFKIGDSISMGDVTTNGTVNLNMITMLRTIGTTTLGTYTSFDTLNNLQLTGIDNSNSRLNYHLDTNTEGQINLVVSGQAGTLTWNQSSTGGIWSTNLKESTWDTTVADKWFQNTDIVNFLNGEEVTVKGLVAPASMNVSEADVSFLCGTDSAGKIQTVLLNNSANMTIDGGEQHSLGFINNSGNLALSGSATATASTWNGNGNLDLSSNSSLSITGDAHIVSLSNRGNLSISGSSSLTKVSGTGDITFSGASLSIAQMTDGSLINTSGTVNIVSMTGTEIDNKGTININGNVVAQSINGIVNLNTGSTLTGLLDGATLTLAGNTILNVNAGSQDSNIIGTGLINVKGDSTLNSLKGTSVVNIDKDKTLNLTSDSSMGSLTSLGMVNNTGTLNLSAGVSNTLGQMTGNGTLLLSGSSQSKASHIAQGTLILQDTAQLTLNGGQVDTLTATAWTGRLVLSINGATKNGTLLTITAGADQLTKSNTSVSLDPNSLSLLNKDITLINSVNFGDGLIIAGKVQNANSSTWLTYTDASGSYIQYQYTGEKIIFANEANVVITKPEQKPTNGTTANIEAKVTGGDVTTGSNNSLLANVNGVASITDTSIGTGIQSATGISSKAESFQIVTKDYVNGELINTKTEEIGTARLGLSLGVGTEITGVDGITSKIENVDYTTVNSDAKVNITGVDFNAGTQLYASNGADIALNATGLKIGDTVITSDIVNNKDALKASSNSLIHNATLDLNNSSLQVEANKTADGGLLDTAMSITNSKIKLTNEIGTGKDTILGSSSSSKTQLNLINSEIGGTGTIQNTNVIGGSLRAGNSPGQLTLTNVNVQGSTFTAQICGGGSAILVNGINKDATTGTGNVGQFLLGSDLNVSGSTFKVENWVDATGKSFDTTTLQAGGGFQFFELAGHHMTGEFSAFDTGNIKLAEGLIWDWSELTSSGIAKVMWSAIADGTRIANTLWTSGQTVANISTEAVKHVGEAVTGKTTVWLSSLNDFTRANSEGISTGYDFNTQGYSVGAQRGIEGGHVIGLAFGNSYGTHTPLQDSTHASAGKIKQDAVMGTVYGHIMLSKADATDDIWSIDAYAGYGEVNNKSDRRVNFDSSNAHAKWNDMVKTVGVQGNYATKLNEKTIVTPFAALDFIHGEQDDFTEQAKSVKASYNNGAYYNLRASLGASISHIVEFSNGMALIPSLTASYGYDVCRMNPHTDVSEAAGDYRAYGVNPGRNSFQITPALSWKINKAWSASTNYTLRTRSGLTDQSVNASVSYTF